MSMSVDQLTARSRTIELGGRTLRVSPLTVDDLGDLQAWIFAQLPDPLELYERAAKDLSPSARDGLFRETLKADREARLAHRIGMPGAGELTQSLLGVIEVLHLGARKNHPDLSKDEVATLVMSSQSDRVDRATATAFGVEQGDDDAGDATDPKSGSAADGPAPSTSKSSS